MPIEVQLRNLTDAVRNLLDCDTVGLLLDCPEPTLRHPLLNLLHRNLSSTTFIEALPIDSNEQIWALCDMAMQTGTAWSIDCLARREAAVKSIAIAPLKRPGGILGLLLMLDTQPGAFRSGEYRLLGQYLPLLAQIVEALLSDSSLPLAQEEDREIYTEVREQSELISLVSHELRVPLAAIKGYAGLLQAYSGTPCLEGNLAVEMTEARQQQYLSGIMEQTKHLEVLISDLFDMSRIQAGRLTLRRTVVDLAQVCQRVAQLVQHRVDAQQPGHYAIRCYLDTHLPPAWADPDRVQQILTNLVENAVKYSPRGGLIEILAHTRRILGPVELCPITGDSRHIQIPQTVFPARHPLKVSITVRDWGIGISQQQQAILFKPFTRLEHPATSHVHGFGLGLYISRKLVEAMDGCMMLKSHEGRGTSVTFTLPIERT